MCRFSLDFFLELKNHVDQGGIFELKECGNSNLKKLYFEYCMVQRKLYTYV